MRNDITPLSLKGFTYIKREPAKPACLVAEASNFGAAFKLERLFDDACDIGIAIESHRTGKVRAFYLAHTETREGEVLAWHFNSCEGEVLSVTIFND